MKREQVDSDMESRELQWSRLGEPAPCLSKEAVAYRFAGFGTHEIVIYYDFVRMLITDCWERMNEGTEIPTRFSSSLTTTSTPKSTSAPPACRSSLYTDNVPSGVSAGDVIRVPAWDGRVAWVTRDNVSAAALAVLTGSGHEGRSYDITGPEALTMAETAERLSAAVGRKIIYWPQTAEEARQTRSASRFETFEAERRMLTGIGLDEYEVEVFVTHFLQIAAGNLSRVSDAVRSSRGVQPSLSPSISSAIRRATATSLHNSTAMAG